LTIRTLETRSRAPAERGSCDGRRREGGSAAVHGSFTCTL
jgi:hypothetical protein